MIIQDGKIIAWRGVANNDGVATTEALLTTPRESVHACAYRNSPVFGEKKRRIATRWEDAVIRTEARPRHSVRQRSYFVGCSARYVHDPVFQWQTVQV